MLAAFDLLVFTETAGFVHSSIDEGVAAVQSLGQANNFSVTHATDSSIFTTSGLSEFEAVLFLNTTGTVLNGAELAAFQDFIRAGGGFAGVHAASDTQRLSDWYLDLVGAEFWTHPAQQTATVLVEDRSHASTAHLPDRWPVFEEWYDFQANPRGDVQVLMSLDTTSYANHRMGNDHPISWYQYFEGGRSWYTGLGHRENLYQNELYLDHLLGGIRFAAGFAPADQGGGIDGNFNKKVLAADVSNPVSLDIAEDGRVFIVEITGSVKVWHPGNEAVTTAATFSVDVGGENGLLGIALDPNFAANNWVYLMYTPKTPSGGQQIQRISRLTFNGTALDKATEVVLLEYPSTPSATPHTAGSLAFGPDGTLYISAGDDTSSSASNGYAPLDEQPGREFNDAQRTAANNNDLRGSILRIKPEADGTYSIPAGNLFPADGSAGRSEIYVMGVRNPFRISIDPETGWLYWGDVGPDAQQSNAARGPRGYDEINQARQAGNFGWPYIIADNQPYIDYDFATGISGAPFDPDNLVNDSPNNTGSANLPDAQPAFIWYPYASSTEFPEFGEGSRTAQAGPVYHFDASLESDIKLPASFDNSLFVYDWARSTMFQVQLDDAGEILNINPFVSDVDFVRPIEMELGPDGALYVIEWGTNFGGGNGNAQVVRLEYMGNLPKTLGDYNDDEKVNLADYTSWRDALGTTSPSPADGDNDGVVNRADYNLWKQNFGVAVAPLPATSNADNEPSHASTAVSDAAPGSATPDVGLVRGLSLEGLSSDIGNVTTEDSRLPSVQQKVANGRTTSLASAAANSDGHVGPTMLPPAYSDEELTPVAVAAADERSERSVAAVDAALAEDGHVVRWAPSVRTAWRSLE